MSIPLGSNFYLGSDLPLDDRVQKTTFSDLNTVHNKYDGLEVWLVTDQKKYRYQSGTWIQCYSPTLDEFNAHKHSILHSPDGTKTVISTDNSSLVTVNGSINLPTGNTYRINGANLNCSHIGAEPALGNPSVGGYILSSTTDGTRVWIPASQFQDHSHGAISNNGTFYFRGELNTGTTGNINVNLFNDVTASGYEKNIFIGNSGASGSKVRIWLGNSGTGGSGSESDIYVNGRILISPTMSDRAALYINGTNTSSALEIGQGIVALTYATTYYASLRIPHGTTPTSPVNGDMWTTISGLYVRINGTTVGPLGSSTGNATTLQGMGLCSSGNYFSKIISVGSDGVTEMGKYIDFHNTSGDTSDFSNRIESGTANNMYINNNLIIHSGNIGSQSANYASTAGYASNAGSLGGIPASDYAQGTSVGYQFSLGSAGWIRIAYTTSYSAYGNISISNNYYNDRPAPVTFNFGITYRNAGYITQIGGTNELISKARIVYPTASNDAYYIEVYCAATSVNNTYYITLNDKFGVSLYTSYVAGSIPTGYASNEITFTNGIATNSINVNGTALVKGLLQAYRFPSASNLPALTMDKPGSYAYGIGPDGTNMRVRYGTAPLDGSTWNSTGASGIEHYFDGIIVSTNRIDANSNGGSGGYISSGNYSGTGIASWHPAGIYSDGPNWFYGTTYFNYGTAYFAGILRDTNQSKWYIDSGNGGCFFTGYSTSWGYSYTSGGMLVNMGTSTGATWLVGGISGGTFRGGVQLLDTGSTMRLYANANYIQFDSSGLFLNGTRVSMVGHSHTEFSSEALTLNWTNRYSGITSDSYAIIRRQGKVYNLQGYFKTTSGASTDTARFLCAITGYVNPGYIVRFPISIHANQEGAAGYINTSGEVYVLYYTNTNAHDHVFNATWIVP